MYQRYKRLGFVIANQSEEYLFDYRFFDDCVSLAWTSIPGYAMRFKSNEIARNVLKRIESHQSLFVLKISESSTHFFVESLPDDRSVPSWLSQVSTH